MKQTTGNSNTTVPSITVGRLAAKYGLSRSTLLYYDSIDLLSPTLHRKGEYRLYTEDDAQRLAQICRYREAGIPLKEIKVILEAPESEISSILEERFAELNDEILTLYQQQRVIAELLKNKEKIAESGALTKQLWSDMMANAGYSEADMRNWHISFERTDPDKHQLFLERLHIPDEEIATIRGWGQTPTSPPTVR